MEFDITPVTSSIIMVVGVGGGGGNAVSHMYRQGQTEVSYLVCNTDAQALAKSPVPNKIQMGEGLGAGNNPERGKIAAQKSVEQIKEMFKINNTHMVFVTAGMGGGTGTGAAPVIASVAKEMGILTVAIVTIPFESEGRPRIEQAMEGIAEIRKHVDSLIVINNAHIVEIYGDLPISQAFAKSDDTLAIAAKGISDIIVNEHVVNVDFADVKRVMENSGIAIMGAAEASGEGRAVRALEEAMSSPLLHHRSIDGADQVLVSISSCKGEGEITMSETNLIATYVQEKSNTNNNTNLIWGFGFDDSLEAGHIRATVVATGFDHEALPSLKQYYKDSFTSPAAQSEAAAEMRPTGAVYVDLEEQPTKTKPNAYTTTGASEFEVVDGAAYEGYGNSQREASVDTSVYGAPAYGSMSYGASSYSPPAGEDSSEQAPSKANDTAGADSGVETATTGVSSEAGAGAAGTQARRRIFEMSPEEIENTPAWYRRNANLDTQYDHPRRSRETESLDD